MDTVIVGIEDLDRSRAALDLAVKEATLRGARLLIVHTWDIPIAPRPGQAYSHMVIDGDMEEAERQAERTVSQALERAAGLNPGLPVEGKAVFGEQVENLIDEARTALQQGDVLLLVQDGPRARFAARSTASRLAHRAPCPLTIVPAQKSRPRTNPRPARRTSPKPSACAGNGGRSGPADLPRTEKDYSMLSLADIAALGKVEEDAVRSCAREDPQFPEPVVHLSTGDLYDRYSIYKWAIEAGLKGLEPVP